MIIREAREEDIDEIMSIRFSVKENVLTDTDLIPIEMVKNYLFIRGQGWVCEINKKVVGFSIVDVVDSNVWALFVHPDFEGLGIGKKLFRTLTEWYFSKFEKKLWLTTEKGSRAEKFYHQSGWKSNGKKLSTGEVRFTLKKKDWIKLDD